MILFVTGMFRSGTTLLSRILDVHRNIALPYDPYFPFFKSLRNKKAEQVGIEVKRDEPLDDYYFSTQDLRLFEAIQDGDLNVPLCPNELERLKGDIYQHGQDYSPRIVMHIEQVSGRTYRDLFMSLLSIIEKHCGKQDLRYVGFKEVWTDEFIPALIKTFPEIKIIQVLRDPRAVCASKNYSKAAYPWLFLIRQWRKHASLFWYYGKRFNKNVLSIKYEELISSPHSTICKICNFLEIPYLEEMLDPKNYKDGMGNPWLQNTSYADKKQAFNTNSIYRWKEVLNQEERRYIELLCFPEMLLNGYYDVDLGINNLSEFFFNPPVVDMAFLAQWIKKYFPTHKVDTIFEMYKERVRIELLTNRIEPVNGELVRSCFLIEEVFASIKGSCRIPFLIQ